MLGVLLRDTRGVLKPHQRVMARPIQSVVAVGELDNVQLTHELTSLTDFQLPRDKIL